MSTAEFLASLRRQGVEFRVVGEQLHCNAPKGVLTPSLQQELAARKREILAELRAAAADGPPPAPPQPAPRAGEPPLSFAQESLWFLHHSDPTRPTYNVPQAFRIRGPLDVAALRQSFQGLVGRHEALRTTCRTVNGRPCLHVAAEWAVPLPVVDLRGMPDPERDAEAARLATDHARKPFDFEQGPLLRVTLLRLADDDSVLLLTTHQFVVDGWSMRVLGREIAALYEAFTTGHPAPLAGLPVQYVDFAHWQRRWAEGEECRAELEYWKRQLAGAPAALPLPADRPRGRGGTPPGATRAFALPADLSHAVRALSRREGATLFMTLLAALQTLLHRYTQHDDIVVGTTASLRTRTEFEGVIGSFGNNLALRTDLSGDPPFRELLARVRDVALGAYAHQTLPFEKLVKELPPQPGMGYAPLFQVMFTLHESTLAQALALPGLTVTPLAVDNGMARVDLYLTVSEGGDRLAANLTYSTDLFDGPTIDRMVSHLQTLLAGAVEDPDRRIGDLPLLTEAERLQLLVEWNDSAADVGRGLCVHQVFERQAARRPDAVALTGAGREWTYQELNGAANQLARHLRRLGVGPEVPVGLCLGPCDGLIVGMLAVLKAGGAYVPLDPADRVEQLTSVVRDARPPVILTQRRWRDRLPGHDSRVICLDAEGDAFAGEGTHNLEDVTGPDNLAYVIHTSGSTGPPRGVLMPHRAAARLLLGLDHARPDEDQTWLQWAPVSSAASAFEIWAALLHGGRLVQGPEGHSSWSDLGRLIEEHRVTCLYLTAAAFNAVLDERPEALSGLRQLLIGGEALSAAHVERALRVLPGVRLINAYGPAEVAGFSCCYPIPADAGGGPSIPIGRPIANARVYVLDGRMRPVPAGVAGELYVGGDGLARGYLNRPDLTAERFVPDPFTADPAARLYKTGDRARWRAGGAVEFLGRLDDQVKVRGSRVEPAEVEAALGRHPAVRACAVVARDDPAGEKGLVAFLALHPGQAATSADLRHFAGRQLPAYQVPALFEVVDDLPLTRQGKVDRRALQGRPVDWAAAGGDYVVPDDPMRVMFARIWEELLNVRPVGIRDDFFALGGNSLLAVEMAARVEAALGWRLPLDALFGGATIEHLSLGLLEAAEGQEESPLTVVRAGAGKRPFFFLHGDFFGGGLYCRNLARHLDPDQPLYAIHPHGVAGQPLLRTLDARGAEHVKLMRAVQPEGPYLLGGYCNGALEAFEIALQLTDQGQRVDLLFLMDPLPPKQAPRGSTPYRGLGAAPSRVPPAPAGADDDNLDPHARRRVALDFCTGVCASYVPRRYPGRVTILQSGDDLPETADPSRGWNGLADAVEVHVIPGRHFTSITTYVLDAADHLRRCLRRAHGEEPGGASFADGRRGEPPLP
jgi:amino acid adenylation domain-containing protein